MGSDNPTVANAYAVYGQVLFALEQLEGSQRAFRKSFEICRKVIGAEHWRTACQEVNLARTLTRLERLEESEGHLLNGYRILVDRFGPENLQTVRAAQGLCDLYEAKGDSTQAALWNARLEQSTKVEDPGN